jgi:hypothetical protein
MPLDLSAADVCRVARACSAIRIGRSIPTYLKRFLAIRLRPVDPALSRRVGALDPGEMDELCRKVRALQQARQRNPGGGLKPFGPGVVEGR